MNRYGIKSSSYIARYYYNLDIEISSLMVESTNSESTKKAITSFIDNYYNGNKEYNLLCTLGEEYTKIFVKEFEVYKKQYPNLKVFIFDLVDDIYETNLDVYIYNNNIFIK